MPEILVERRPGTHLAAGVFDPGAGEIWRDGAPEASG